MRLPSCPMPPDRQAIPSPWYVTVGKQITLAIVLWLTHFLHSSRFGLYEDDWNRVPKIIGIRWHDIWTMIWPSILSVSGQGRPLHTACILFFSFIGFKLGAMQGVYLVAFAMLLCATLLFQAFLNKVFQDKQFAFLGALAFIVYPADTTQLFITHAFGLQTAMIMLLIGFLLYLSGWKTVSYLVVTLILLTYETPYLVFAAAPLLLRRKKYELRRHWAIMFGILVTIAVLRVISSDNRVSHLAKRDLFLGGLNIITGPLTCLSMYVYRPLTTLFVVRGMDAVVVLLCSLGLSGAIAMMLLRGDRPVNEHVVLDERRRQLFIGVLLLLLAYPLTLTTTGIAVSGRGTRAHTAAVLGASILCAWVCSCVLSRAASIGRSRGAALLVGCFYGLLVGFGLSVQHDYALAWQEQRDFWTELIALCPSLQDGDVIFLEPAGLRDTRQLLFLRKDITGKPDTRQIKSLDEVYRVLPYLYAFPSQWQTPPRVFRLPLNWESKIFSDGDLLNPLTIEEGFAYEPGTQPPIPSSHAIFLDTKDGHLTRRSSLVNKKNGDVLSLKVDPEELGKYAEKPVYPYVIYPDGRAKSSYLVR